MTEMAGRLSPPEHPPGQRTTARTSALNPHLKDYVVGFGCSHASRASDRSAEVVRVVRTSRRRRRSTPLGPATAIVFSEGSGQWAVVERRGGYASTSLITRPCTSVSLRSSPL